MWVSDGLRFAGEQEVRERNNLLLKQMFRERGIDIVSINGDYFSRLDKAKKLVEELIRN